MDRDISAASSSTSPSTTFRTPTRALRAQTAKLSRFSSREFRFPQSHNHPLVPPHPFSYEGFYDESNIHDLYNNHLFLQTPHLHGRSPCFGHASPRSPLGFPPSLYASPTLALSRSGSVHNFRPHARFRRHRGRRGFPRSPSTSNVELVPALRRTALGRIVLPFALGALRSAMSFVGRTVSIVSAHKGPFLVGTAAVAVMGLGTLVVRQSRRDSERQAVSARTVENLAPFVLPPNVHTEFVICTYNVRGIMDRYDERTPLLRQELADIDADIYGFQEILTGEFAQERHILDPSYSVFGCRAALANMQEAGGAVGTVARAFRALLNSGLSRPFLLRLPRWAQAFAEACNMYNAGILNLRNACMAPFFGNSIASRLPAQLASRHDVLTLRDFRAAQRVLVWMPAAAATLPASSDAAAAEESTWRDPATGEHVAGAIATSVQRGQGTGGSPMAAGPLDSRPGPAHVQVMGDSELFALQYSKKGYHTVPDVSEELSLAHEPGREARGGPAWVARVERARRREGLVPVWVVNTHLVHDCPGARARQAEEILAWMGPVADQAAAVLVVGDLNAPPEEPLHKVFAAQGYRSAFRTVHGREPSSTWPSGIVAPLMDHGEPHCADYIYVKGGEGVHVELASAELRGTKPDAGDSTLYPSDHVALRAVIRLTSSTHGKELGEEMWERGRDAVRKGQMMFLGDARQPFATAYRRADDPSRRLKK